MNLKKKLFFLFLILVFNGCETIKKKSDEVAERENEKLSQFIGKKAEDLKTELGLPNEDYIDEKGNKIFIYKTKKYGIPCERKFEIDTNNLIVGFRSSGCI